MKHAAIAVPVMTTLTILLSACAADEDPLAPRQDDAATLSSASASAPRGIFDGMFKGQTKSYPWTVTVEVLDNKVVHVWVDWFLDWKCWPKKGRVLFTPKPSPVITGSAFSFSWTEPGTYDTLTMEGTFTSPGAVRGTLTLLHAPQGLCGFKITAGFTAQR